jgi:sacsin
MTTAIATIIRDYNSGQVIQELLQNCDDARARNVTFVLDKRSKCCKLGNSLDPFMGPALLQYDDAVFLPKDFASLQKTGDSEKKVNHHSLIRVLA